MSQESSRTCSSAISWSESHASLSNEISYRFKHVLIRDRLREPPEVRARDPPRALRRLAGRACGDELLEIRAYHLEQAASLLAELDGAPPAELAKEAAATLQEAGRRALAREANQAARHAFLRAVELGRRSSGATSRRRLPGAWTTCPRSPVRWRPCARRARRRPGARRPGPDRARRHGAHARPIRRALASSPTRRSPCSTGAMRPPA